MNIAAFPAVSKASRARLGGETWRSLLIAGAALLAMTFSATPAPAQAPPMATAVTVRHSPVVNGRVEGSVQVLLGESISLNGGTALEGDLLVPGTPRVVVNGKPAFQGTLDGSGSAQPSNYQITINGGAEVRHVRRRTDPVALPSVPLPPAAAGTRSVVINSSGQSVGDWATVRDLTLNSNAGLYNVPPGTYNRFIANGGAGFVLGVAGATQASVYNFEEITLNGNARLHVIGPVVVNVASRVSLNGGSAAGSPESPQWLSLNVSRFGVTLNSGSLYGSVRAPAGTVQVNSGTLRGVVASDRLILNAGTIQLAPADTTPPVLTLSTPADGFITDSTTVLVSGTVEDLTAVQVRIGETGAYVNGTTFVAQVELPEGISLLRMVATDAAGNESAATRTVTADATAPVLSDLAPPAGTLIEAREVTVGGRVADATTVAVQVGPVTATVGADGTFVAPAVPLVEGENALPITATDVAGNVASAELVLTGQDLTPPAAPFVFPVAPLTRRDNQAVEGRAEPGTNVRVTGGVEPVTVSATAGTGLFLAPVQLAPGANTLRVTVIDSGGNISPAVLLSVTSDPQAPLPPPGEPAYLSVSTGDAQRGLTGAELPRPLIAVVKDQTGAPMEGVDVAFSVVHGGGRFVEGGETLVVPTDADGYARARYISGDEPGPQLVRASFPGNLFPPTTFSALALAATPGQTTSYSGVVRDVNLRALPNVLVRLGGQQTRTGADGRFRIENPPAGPHQLLELIGRDQITLPGRWPNISYDVDVLLGVENGLGRPLYLPKVNGGLEMPLNTAGVVTEDTAVEVPVVGGEPPVRIVARAGTRVTFPPDVTDKRLSVTRIPVDRVPMPLEDGRATNLYISVQPSGALFDPPLAISFPNLDRLPPASEVLLMSFDHDAGRYVQVGTGHVSADGTTVESDPGSGIRVGAWHATPPPPPGAEVNATAQLPVLGNPKVEGRHIDDVTASVYGTTATPLTPRPVWHDAPEVLLRATFYVPRNAPPPATRYDAEAQLSVPTATLAMVSFDDNYTLKADDGTTKYEEPHWTIPTPASPTPTRHPVAYEDGKRMKAAATFNLSAEVVPTDKIKVKLDGPDAYDFENPAPAKVEKGNKKLVKMEGASVKPPFTGGRIDYFEPMSLKWQVALDSTNFADAGTSANQLYVTLSKPSEALHSLVHVATKKLKGVSGEANIFKALWDEFTDRSVMNVGNVALKYWGPTSTASSYDLMKDNTTAGLLRLTDGRCGSWHFFFNDVLKVQGVTGDPSSIIAKARTGYTDKFESGLLVGPNKWQATDGSCTTVQTGHTEAQGNPTPGAAKFTDHAVVRYKGRIYDPSYGREFPDLKAWENGSLHGTFYQDVVERNPDGTPKRVDDCHFVPNNPKPGKDTEETCIYSDSSTTNPCAPQVTP